jgi:hypothetical protein
MSHGENAPSDWYCSAHQRRCDLCGRSYHASEGGCDCTADLDDCACGRNEWERRDRGLDMYTEIVCSRCGTEPGAEPEEPEDE